MSSLVETCALSIVHVHRVLESWFLGGSDDPSLDIEGLARVLAPGFVLISPRGVITARDPLLEEIRGGRGAWAHEHPKGRIVVDSIEARHVGDELALMTYVERHLRVSGETARLSSALMQRDDAVPGGVVWLHLHETWMNRA